MKSTTSDRESDCAAMVNAIRSLNTNARRSICSSCSWRAFAPPIFRRYSKWSPCQSNNNRKQFRRMPNIAAPKNQHPSRHRMTLKPKNQYRRASRLPPVPKSAETTPAPAEAGRSTRSAMGNKENICASQKM